MMLVLAVLPDAANQLLQSANRIVTTMPSAMIWGVSVLLVLVRLVAPAAIRTAADARTQSQRPSAARQLAAVRGEVTKLASPNKGMLLITVKPTKEFQEVTVLARENDLVGAAVARAGDSDLLGLLSGDSRDDETITAAELNEGDVVSVIYDPQLQNKVIEIYLH